MQEESDDSDESEEEEEEEEEEQNCDGNVINLILGGQEEEEAEEENYLDTLTPEEKQELLHLENQISKIIHKRIPLRYQILRSHLPIEIKAIAIRKLESMVSSIFPLVNSSIQTSPWNLLNQKKSPLT
jgi:hypothetical protein